MRYAHPLVGYLLIAYNVGAKVTANESVIFFIKKIGGQRLTLLAKRVHIALKFSKHSLTVESSLIGFHKVIEDIKLLIVTLALAELSVSKKKLVKRYFGKDVAVDKQIAYEWMRIPHFYTCFYVYKYSTCISAASAIVKRIEKEGEAYVSQYIDFLKCGNAKSPLDSLLVAGIDMTKPEVITGAIEDFADCVRQFREIYEKNN